MEVQPGIHIHLGDCLEVMNEIPDHSVDMVMADLPYGTTDCEWDSVIPLEPLWVHYKRIIKPRGAIVLTASQPFTTVLITSNMGWFKYCWVWKKNNATGYQMANARPLKNTEDVCVFSPSPAANVPEQMSYHPQGLTPYGRKNRRGSRGGYLGLSGLKKSSYFQEFTNYPNTILPFDYDEDKLHPTQKPVALMEYLICTYTNEGELVLDNTMGSGTTGIACIRSGRNFTGIEKDPDIFETARQRLSGGKPHIIVIGDSVLEQSRLF